MSMTPMAKDALASALSESNRLFGKLAWIMETSKKKELSLEDNEQLKNLGKEIFLFEEQYHRKSYGNDLLILSPITHTLSLLVKSLLIGKGPGSLMFTLSLAFLPVNKEGDETKLVGEALTTYAKRLTGLFTASFFSGIDQSHREFLELLVLVYLGVSFSIGQLALGVEKEDALEEASDEIKQRVELTKDIATLYASLFMQCLMQQQLIETCMGNTLEKPYGMELKTSLEQSMQAVLEFVFLGCFIQGLYAKDQRKAESMFKELIGQMKERVGVFEAFIGENPLNPLPAVTEIRFTLAAEDMDSFIEALNGLITSLGIDERIFYKDLEDLQKLVQTCAFIISAEELRKATTHTTGSVQV